MANLRFVFLLITCLCCFTFGHAQKQAGKFSQHAKKMYRKANRLVKNGQYNRAILFYKQSLFESPAYIDAYLKIADILERKQQTTEAIGFLSSAINIDVNYSFSYADFFIKVLKSRNEINSAISIAQLVLSKPELAEMERRKMEIVLESLQLMQNVEGQKLSFELINLGDSVNTPLAEYFPTLNLDESKMVFTRVINGANEDFFEAIRDSNKIWHKAKNAGYPPNTSMPDGAACISADGRYLFYTRCDAKSANGITGGGCDVYYSFYTDSGWSAQQKFGYTINTTAYEGMPTISSNNFDLYFVSDRKGGFGGKDIYVSHFENGIWQEPINLGKQINTKEDELAPFIHPDNKTLYFSSKGHAGFGGTDIFVSDKINDTNWTKPMNLGPPINSKYNDDQIFINAYGNRAYLSSERKEGKGKSDIFYASVPGFASATPVKCIKGVLRDKKSKYPIAATKFRFLKDGEYFKPYLSNEGDGSFELVVEAEGVYRVEVELDNYKGFYRNYDFTDPLSKPVIYNKDIQLKTPGLKDTLYYGEFENKLNDSVRRFFMRKSKQWTDDSATVKVLIQYEYTYCFDSLQREANKLYLNDSDSVCYQAQQEVLQYIQTLKDQIKTSQEKNFEDTKRFFEIETKPMAIEAATIVADPSQKRKRLSVIKIYVVEYY